MLEKIAATEANRCDKSNGGDIARFDGRKYKREQKTHSVQTERVFCID
jgi:hypothetical protein